LQFCSRTQNTCSATHTHTHTTLFPGIPTTFQGCMEDSSLHQPSLFSSHPQPTPAASAAQYSSNISNSSSSINAQHELHSSCCCSSCSAAAADGSSSLRAQVSRFSWVRLYFSLLGSVAVVHTLKSITGMCVCICVCVCVC